MFLVTGASGHVGRMAAELLIAEVGPERVILTTRHPADLDALSALGASVRYADFADPGTLDAAFAGAERMLLISTAQVGSRVPQHEAAIAAARRSGIEYLVYTSIVGAGNEANQAEVCLEHRATERLIRDSGLRWNVLRDAQYAEAPAYFVAPAAVATGQLVGNFGDGTVGFVAREDCAAAAVGALLGRGEDNRSYEVTGPELLSYRDVADLVAELAGAPITYGVLTDEEQYAIFDSIGVPREFDAAALAASPIPWNSDDMVSFGRAIRLGQMSSLSDAVETLALRPPRSLRSVLTEAAATWPPSPAQTAENHTAQNHTSETEGALS